MLCLRNGSPKNENELTIDCTVPLGQPISLFLHRNRFREI